MYVGFPYPAYRLWPVTSGLQFLGQLGQVFFQMGSKLLDSLAVNAGLSFIGLHLPEGIPQIVQVADPIQQRQAQLPPFYPC